MLSRFLVLVLLHPSLCCCRADGSGPDAFFSCSSFPPPMSSSSLWLSLLVHLWLSCASCHVRVSHVAYTTYYGTCTLIVHASLSQLFLSPDANGLGTSQGNLYYKNMLALRPSNWDGRPLLKSYRHTHTHTYNRVRAYFAPARAKYEGFISATVVDGTGATLFVTLDPLFKEITWNFCRVLFRG